MNGEGARVIAVPRHPWRRIEVDGAAAHVVGDAQAVEGLAAALVRAPNDNARAHILAAADFLFAVIVETPDFAIAACDLVRSTPVYFGRTADGWMVSNDARSLAVQLARRDLDRTALLEIEMAGYATGGATAYADLRVLECGSSIVLGTSARDPEPQRYFRYRPQLLAAAGDDVTRLGDMLDVSFAEVIRRTHGRRVLVPVSGGLDSRLVLAKLVEHGCADLASFSYGAPGNTDARAGREVAAKLGVPWRFVPSLGPVHRVFFRGEAGQDHWRFSDGLTCVPSPQDIVPLSALREQGALDPAPVIVNGQTGDFLSGGHIPAAMWSGEVARETLLGIIASKHYGLWRSLATPERLRTIEGCIERVTGPLPAMLAPHEAIARYELWEYEARQAGWVVNAQRTYEYLGLGWELPLWDPRLIRFFRDLPPEAKRGQRIYRDYLTRWNYAGLFAGFARARSSWPGWSRPLAAVEKAALVLGGPGLQRRANATLRYFGHYRHQYAELSFGEFLAVRHDMRHILGDHAKRWLRSNGFPLAGEGV